MELAEAREVEDEPGEVGRHWQPPLPSEELRLYSKCRCPAILRL